MLPDSPRRRALAGAGALAGFGLLVFLLLGMGRGLLLSSDIESRRFPWAPFFPERGIQAPALSDPVWQFVPWLRFARRQLLAGRLPLWNPHQDGGVPLLGNAQSALLSPLSWPVLLFGVDPGWNLSLLARILLAAAGAFLLLRDLGRSPVASALGAAVFSLSGPFVAWLEHPQTLSAAPVPLLLLFVRRAGRRGSRRDVAGLAVTSLLVLSGGHPETALMAGILAAAFLLSTRAGGDPLARPAAGALLGAGLAAPALFPFAEYFLLSAARGGEGRRPFVLPLRDLARFLAPRLSGSNVVEAAATVSVALLLLLPIGLAGWRRERETRFFALAAFGMLAATYDNPAARALARAMPLYWTRWLLLLPLALAAVGASGLDRLRGALVARGRRTAGEGLALLLLVAAGGELLRAAAGVHGVTPPGDLGRRTPLLARLQADTGVFRILPLHTMLSPDSATEYGLDDLRGYDALAPAGWRRERARIGRFVDLPTQRDAIEPWDLAPGGAALDDWNVEYLLQPPPFPFGPETFAARKGLDLEEVYSGPDGRIFRNRRVKPRVRLEGRGEVRILERSPGRWRVAVRAAEAGLLRVADPYFPGWRATVDGRPLSLAAHPGAPMTVPLAAGVHEVALAYQPASVLAGAAVGLACLTVVAFLLRRG